MATSTPPSRCPGAAKPTRAPTCVQLEGSDAARANLRAHFLNCELNVLHMMHSKLKNKQLRQDAGGLHLHLQHLICPCDAL